METIFDSLNAKAALVAIREVLNESGRELPVMVSAAVGRGGETMISAQTVEAFWTAMKHIRPLSIGLNCSLGPDLMYPFLAELSAKADTAISCYPNAGLPNPLSATGFDLEPADMARYLGGFAQDGLINIAGGCCETRRPHCRDREGAGAQGTAPAALFRSRWQFDSATCRHLRVTEPIKPLRLSGSQPFTQQPGNLHHARGTHERCRLSQVAGLIKDGRYEEAVAVARQQVENGANVIDICMDEGMIDGVAAMTRYLHCFPASRRSRRFPSWSTQ